MYKFCIYHSIRVDIFRCLKYNFWLLLLALLDSKTYRQAVKHILHYLKGTSHYGLSIQATPNYNLTCFTNVDHASSSDDHQNTSSYFVFMGSNIILWSSTKQKVVSRSTAESKYRAVANGAAELSLIGSLLRELNIATNFISCLYYDNISANYMIANPVFHGPTKHIEIDFHFVREKVFHKNLTMLYIPFADQLADCLTKALPVQRFLHFRNKLTVLTRPLSLRGADK